METVKNIFPAVKTRPVTGKQAAVRGSRPEYSRGKAGCWTMGPLRALPRLQSFYSKLRYTGLFLHTFYRHWLHKASSPSTEATTKSSTNSQDPQGPREE